MLTAIIDYSSGNLHSARKAFEKISASNNLGSVVVTSNPDVISSADRLVLPGDGAFPACKTELLSSEAYDAMVYAAVEKGRPFLGICVGMQLMAIKGYEYEETDGLGWIDGEVCKIDPNGQKFKDTTHGVEYTEHRERAPHLKGYFKWRSCVFCAFISDGCQQSQTTFSLHRLWNRHNSSCRKRKFIGLSVSPRKKCQDRLKNDRKLSVLEPVRKSYID